MTEVSDEMVEAACLAHYEEHPTAWWYINRSRRDNMRASLAAALAARPVRVKALEWVAVDDEALSTRYFANTFVGRYEVETDTIAVKSFQLRLIAMDGRISRHYILAYGHDTVETVFASAHADYESRILAALEEQP